MRQNGQGVLFSSMELPLSGPIEAVLSISEACAGLPHLHQKDRESKMTFQGQKAPKQGNQVIKNIRA